MEDLTGALSHVLDPAGYELVDVESGPGLVRVVVDRAEGVDLEALARANRLVSTLLDELDPFPGRYTLEVTSPGLERPLRRPEHWVRAIGSTVSVRTTEPVEGQRRLTGTLATADAEHFVIEGAELPGGSCRLAYGQVDRARTVFVWGPQPAPGKGKRAPSAKRSPSAGHASGSPALRQAQRHEVTTP